MKAAFAQVNAGWDGVSLVAETRAVLLDMMVMLGKEGRFVVTWKKKKKQILDNYYHKT